MAALSSQTFTNDTPASTLNQFLSQLADEPANQFTIHQRLVSYKNEPTSGPILEDKLRMRGGQSIRLVIGFKS